MVRWRVERAGAPGHYLPGWIAYSPTGMGASFTTHREAFAFARAHADEQARLAWRGVVKLAGRRTGKSTTSHAPRPSIDPELVQDNNPFRREFVGEKEVS